MFVAKYFLIFFKQGVTFCRAISKFQKKLKSKKMAIFTFYPNLIEMKF